MIRINLIPAEEAQRGEARRQEVATGALLFGVTALVLVVAHTWQAAQTRSANRQVRNLQQELVNIQGPYMDVTKMEQQKKELRERLRVIADLEARKLGPVKMLEDLSTASPDKLWLTDFTEAGGVVKLSGLGVDEQTIADFLRRLATSAYFKGVDLEETSMVDSEGVKHKKFSIKATVNYLGATAAQAKATALTKPGAPGERAVR